MHLLGGSASQFATTPHSQPRIGRIAVALALLLALVATAGQWGLSPAAAATSSTILGTSTPTRLVQHSDSAAVEVGTRFTARSDGTAAGMRFWKGEGAAGPHTGTLWSATGKKLAGATFSNVSGSGWQKADFDKAITLTKGESYVVSYHAPKGRYAATQNYTGTSLSPDLAITAEAGVFRYGSQARFPTKTYKNSMYWVDVVFTPTGAATPTPPVVTPTPTPPVVTPTPTPPVVTPTPTPTPPVVTPTPTPPVVTPPAAGGFPSAANTGVPAGTALTDYTGPCRITAPGTVIDAKRVNCGTLSIAATGVSITRSVINGGVYNDDSGTGSFSITDSQVDVGNKAGTGIGDVRFTATRVHVTGGNRSVNCFRDCTLANSYVHGQFRDSTGTYHESGVRMGSGSVIRGNTIACDAPDVAPDAGCSAALTGYGDFAVVQNNIIDGNKFVGGSGGYCTYGGSTQGKPYSSGTRDIRFTNNVWERGSSGKCGFYGPITSFDTNAPGNVWSNNKWDDGTAVQAAN
ncbi:DUF4082 domain-containing protein [Cryobacterium lactosi]|nr:DUF4082 domain-containing protein [Cryobacterium lactosi]